MSQLVFVGRNDDGIAIRVEAATTSVVRSLLVEASYGLKALDDMDGAVNCTAEPVVSEPVLATSTVDQPPTDGLGPDAGPAPASVASDATSPATLPMSDASANAPAAGN